MSNLICFKCGGRWLPCSVCLDDRKCPWCEINLLREELSVTNKSADKYAFELGKLQAEIKQIFMLVKKILITDDAEKL
jgi:hypothetical protein